MPSFAEFVKEINEREALEVPSPGDFFHSYENGEIAWQGQVLDEPTPGEFEVQLYNWLTGREGKKLLVPSSAMKDCSWYEDVEDMRAAGERKPGIEGFDANCPTCNSKLVTDLAFLPTGGAYCVTCRMDFRIRPGLLKKLNVAVPKVATSSSTFKIYSWNPATNDFDIPKLPVAEAPRDTWRGQPLPPCPTCKVKMVTDLPFMRGDEAHCPVCLMDYELFEEEPAVVPAPAGVIPQVKLPKAPPAPLGTAAFHGILGDFVRLVEPSTEGDINALVVAFLTAFGSLFGRQPHHYVEDTRHGTNLFSVIVGESAKARKGTITGRVMNLVKLTNKEFSEKRIHKGLSSGEGLVYAIRDAREVPLPKDGEPEMDKQLLAQLAKDRDPGVGDKRLLVIESEFGSVLAQGRRDGNILSETMRDSWDATMLGSMAKTNKDRCQQPHVSLIGNITVDELQRCLTEKDRSNGFGNRILWVYAKRSKVLPCAERVPEKALQVIADRISGLTMFRMPGELKWGESALPLWYAEYARLSAEGTGDGLVDALTARAEAQVLRMAMIYAVLDSSSFIERVHLEAALEVWRYCEDSVKFIFGGATGNKLAEDTLGLLLAKPEGMSQTELSAAFNRKKTAEQLKAALDVLLRLGKVRKEELKHDMGRAATVWVAVIE